MSVRARVRSLAPGLVARLLMGAMLLPALSACAAFSDEPPRRQRDARPLVVAAFYPLRYVVDRVAGSTADVVTLTRPGQEPHDLELSPRDTGEVAVADLVIHSRGLQPSIDDAVDQNASGRILDAARVVGLEPADHDGHDGQDEPRSTLLGGGHEDDLDPHFWLDPDKLAILTDAVRDALDRIDPAHAAEHRAGAASLRADLARLDTSYDAGLADCARRTVVVAHDAFGYLARYGLDLEPVAGLSPDAEATPADIGRLQQLIADQGITTVFGERLSPEELSTTIATDLGLGTAVLDTIEGLTDETADQDYLSLMRANLAALRSANGCS